MLIIVAFICGVAMDVVWTSCVTAVAERRAALAAHLSVMLYLCTVISTVLILDNQWLSIAAFASGNWCGTFATVRWWK